LNVANPDARAVAKQYAHGVVSTKTKKFYCLKESEYAAALAISPNVYMQQLGNKRFIPGIDYNDKKAVKELVHQLEALIYRLMEKDTF